MNVNDIRQKFIELYKNEDFVIDKSGAKVVEIINASFIADEESIFGEVNHDYVQRELAWYLSKSLNVNDIPGGAPTIWKQVADKNGFINSNYGYCVFSEDNGNQFVHAANELIKNPYSRRAAMLYTRPSMHVDYNKNGMSDFMCTYGTQHFIRKGKLITCMLMRSNDAWAGYRNDYAWIKYVHELLLSHINTVAKTEYELGDIYWVAESLHVYERQFYLLDYFNKTGKLSITKDEYKNKFPNSLL